MGWTLAVGLLAAGAAAPAADPSPAAIDRAIERGVAYLLQAQASGGRWQTKYDAHFAGGPEALAVLALLECGQTPDAPKLASALDYLNRIQAETVYARALRTMVYARLDPKDYTRRLHADAQWLTRQQLRSGGWGYGPKHPTTEARDNWTDNANTHFALIALHDAQRRGVTLPDTLLRRTLAYWTRGHNRDGGWGFEPRGLSSTPLRASSYGSLTAAGTESLTLLYDTVILPSIRQVGAMFGDEENEDNVRDIRTRIDSGLHWLRENYSLDGVPRWVWGGKGEEYAFYYLWALTRTADALGLSEYAGGDWATQIAQRLLALQRPDGAWTALDAPPASGDQDDAAVQTAFALLALARCRTPQALQKLNLGGTWGRDHRDVAFLAAYLRRDGTPARCTTLPSAAELPQLLQAPLLYLNAKGGLTLDNGLGERLGDYVRSGGTLLVQSPPGNDAFGRQFAEFFARMLPGGSVIELPAEHPLFSARHRISPVRALGVGDALQTRAFVLLDDLAAAWGAGRTGEPPEAFGLFANLLAYATDDAFPHTRPAPRPAPPDPQRVHRFVPIARVKHAGAWDVCPGAFDRLSEVLANSVSTALRVRDEQDLAAPPPQDVRILWLTGAGDPQLTEPQRKTLKAFLESGGMLFADPAAGDAAFFHAMRTTLQDLLGESAVAPLPADHPLRTGAFAGGMGGNVSAPAFTRAVTQPADDALYAATLNGRTVAVLSRYGVTAPLEGLPVYGCAGLAPRHARRLAANIILYASTAP